MSARFLLRYPPLNQETRAWVDTACAAYHLNRSPNTLRGWACNENGPLRPDRVHRQLMWPITEIRALCEAEGVQ